MAPAPMSAIAAAAALAALATRGVHPTSVLVVAATGVIGLSVMASEDNEQRSGTSESAAVTIAGVFAFAVASLMWTTHSGPIAAAALGAGVVAAVAEEALFRGGLYALLARFGPVTAVMLTAVAFAAVHVPLYGWAAAGVDLAAGVIFGWQRWATGRWSVPAVTHAFANLVAVL